jgi:hypothetical protein
MLRQCVLAANRTLDGAAENWRCVVSAVGRLAMSGKHREGRDERCGGDLYC